MKRSNSSTFHLNAASVEDFVEFIEGANCLALEPTGKNYSELWATIAETHNVSVRWVGHPEVKYLRKSERLPDKNDQADALALATYALKNWEKETAFLRFEPGAIAEINETYLDIKGLKANNTATINRCRAKLASSFPEVAFSGSAPGIDGLSPLFSWVAERARYTDRGKNRYDRLYNSSVGPRYGKTITSHTRYLANQICDNHIQEALLRNRLSSLVYDRLEFAKFNQVFDLFGFGLMARAMLLVRTYPLSRFESEGAFKRRLGFGQEERSSGQIESFSSSGSAIAKSELYNWSRTSVGKKRLISTVGLEVQAKFDEYKAKLNSNSDGQEKGQTGKFTNLVHSRTIAFTLRRLFPLLKKNCVD
ncbi:transposase [Okeania sp. SIO2B3]|uniref:IS110 family transposase n=1 Tax=Okeania sp. SIO2B3 TaxID=2607784 RepID=UPI0013BECAF8|nr:transposase [Okeania sp. SIO2B3]NET47154.1 IS110 family transposase [Okeania sp. SIO2B3]